MKAVNFYKSLLTSTGLQYDEEHNCFYTQSTRVNQPVKINDLVLSLPTTATTKQYNDIKDKVMVYHPVHENALARNSDTLIFTQKLFRVSLSTDYLTLCENLLRLAADVDMHERLNADQREIISQFIGADEKMLKAFEQIANKTDPNKQHKALDLMLQRGDSSNGASRIAKVKWDLLDELHKSKDHIYGVKLRKKDVATLEKLHQIIFEFKGHKLVEVSPSMQMVSTSELVAPSFRVLCELYLEVKNMFITLYQLFQDIFTPITSTDTSWEEGLTKLKSFRTLIPAFPGNEGGDPVKGQEIPTDFTTPKPKTTTTPSPSPAPVVQPTNPYHAPARLTTMESAKPAPSAPAPVTVDTSAVNAPLTASEVGSFMDYVNAHRHQPQPYMPTPAYQPPAYAPRGYQPVAPQGPQIDYRAVGGGNYTPPPAPQPYYPNQYNSAPNYAVPQYGYGRNSRHGNMR